MLTVAITNLTDVPYPSDETLYWLARAAVTKYHTLGASNDRTSCSCSSGSCKSEIKVSVRLVPSEDSEAESVPCLS